MKILIAIKNILYFIDYKTNFTDVSNFFTVFSQQTFIILSNKPYAVDRQVVRLGLTTRATRSTIVACLVLMPKEYPIVYVNALLIISDTH